MLLLLFVVLLFVASCVFDVVVGRVFLVVRCVLVAVKCCWLRVVCLVFVVC